MHPPQSLPPIEIIEHTYRCLACRDTGFQIVSGRLPNGTFGEAARKCSSDCQYRQWYASHLKEQALKRESENRGIPEEANHGFD